MEEEECMPGKMKLVNITLSSVAEGGSITGDETSIGAIGEEDSNLMDGSMEEDIEDNLSAGT